MSKMSVPAGAATDLFGFRPTTARRLAVIQSNHPIRMHEIQESHSAVLILFNSTRVHPYRLVYALAGRLFDAQSPTPFGGPSKATPGYAKFNGTNAQDLLKYIISETINTGNKSMVEYVAKAVNSLLDAHFSGDKERVDEQMLRGMKKAGHIQWHGQFVIPCQLSHVDEIGASFKMANVEFDPARYFI
ncbi:hypothetical protein HDU98_000872 [Podochytrium sp. JEL0797]|nr:hypothetical protein HDU98_000872 [Podochytrium sp. JEL0797]